MDPKSMEPYGLALVDFFNGDSSVTAVIHRDDGYRADLPISLFFRARASFSPLEVAALALCRGSVLDVGAGSGHHTIELQDRGLSVCAIDICPESVYIMLRRGIKDVHCVDISDFKGGPFDSLLLLGHGIGMVETIVGLDRFLKSGHKLLKPGGQIVADSLDVRRTRDPIHLSYQEANRRDGRYFGETRIQVEYMEKIGPLYGWLHIDPETLHNRALNAGYSCEVVHQEETGDYLARLIAQ